MTPEIFWMTTQAAWSIGLALLAANGTAWYHGLRWGLGNRSRPAENEGWVGRAHRAHRNHLENFPAFVALVVALHLTETHSASTEFGAALFSVGRFGHGLTYIAGVTWMAVRTLFYFASLGGLALMAAAWGG